MSKTVLFQTIQFSIQKQFHFKQFSRCIQQLQSTGQVKKYIKDVNSLLIILLEKILIGAVEYAVWNSAES